MMLHHWKARFLFVLLALYTVDSVAVNFSQCFTDVISCADNASSQACTSLNISNATAFSLLRTSKGTPVVAANDATALSYLGCKMLCGGGLEPSGFSWAVFSQQYAQWLLPYLALLSQLPFGAQRRTDNLMSVVLTLGSPTLAGYSLYMTLLNARWLNTHLFRGLDYPSPTVRQSVVRALSSLQQVPLRVHPGDSAQFEYLIVHPRNDDWWTTFATELDYSHTWSISSATSIVWVVIAYLLTVADSLSSVANNFNSSGQGIGSVWLWLLSIIMGWLILSPKCDYDRVCKAYHKANKHLVVPGSQDPPAHHTPPPANLGLTISPCSEWATYYPRNVTSSDELRIPPIFNYARALSWSRAVYVTSLYYRTAWQKSGYCVAVNGLHIPADVHSDVPRDNRPTDRDQIIQYCTPDRHVSVLWPRRVVINMIVASIMSLQLQWGTTFGAVLAARFTPTIGFGCRTLAYLIYGILSTIVWMLLLLSSILGYCAHHPVVRLPDLENNEGHSMTARNSSAALGSECNVASSPEELESSEDALLVPNEFAAAPPRSLMMVRVADWLRWMGKFLAAVNAIGIITNSIFQLAGVYDNCYCDSSIYTWGPAAFTVIAPHNGDIDLARGAWIGALALGLTCSTLFVGSIYLIPDSLP